MRPSMTEPSPPSLRIPIPQSDSQSTISRRRSVRIHPMSPGTPPSVSISPIDIQSHLYTSLLEARTADVALKVRGSWKAVYRLHRVVLIQAVSPTVLRSWNVHSTLLAGLLPISIHVWVCRVYPKVWTSTFRSRRDCHC